MWQKEKKYNSIISLATLLALASTPVAATFFVSIAVAQTAKEQFPLPESIPSGTTVKIDGSSSMARINDNLKQSFEQQFSGTKVDVATNGTDAAISALSDGKIDLAAMGRGLTSKEEAKGLEQYRLRREKIAIVVDENNPFKGNLTDKQFAAIFRGEITDWSQVGGAKGKIRFIDRPASSDTREAFRNYPIFRAGNFAAGSTATQLSEDSSSELAKQLGKDGIGYALANQVSKIPGLRVLKLHQTLPNDLRYPFSQPLVYAYKKNPPVGVAGFLGFSASANGTKAVEAARSAEAVAIAQNLSGASAVVNTATPETTAASPSVSTTASVPGTDTTNTSTVNGTTNQTTTINNQSNQALSPNGNAATAEAGSPFPWWLLLPIAALGAIGLWLLGRRKNNQEILEASPSEVSGLPIANTPEVDINPIQPDGISLDPLEDGTSSHDLAANTATGAVLAGGAIVGAGLWSRLMPGEDNTSNKNIPPKVELTNSDAEVPTNLEEPAAVVMPSYSEVDSIPQVDVNAANAMAAATPEGNIAKPVIDIELSNDDATSAGNSHWLDNMALPGGAAATGPWSRFANRDNEEEPNNDQLNATVDVRVTQDPLPEVSEVPSVQLPDIPEDTQQPNQGESNWLDDTTLAGDAALASGVAGAGLWSRFANSDNNEEEPKRVTIISGNDASDIPFEELTSTSVNISEVPDIPEVELTPPSVNVLEDTDISAVATPQITEVPAVEPNSVSEPLPDVWEDTPKDEPQTGLNWLSDITLAGGATVAGAGLWSRLANQDRGNEISDENISNDTAPLEDTPVETVINADVPTVEFVEDTPVETVINPNVPTVEFVEDTPVETVINPNVPTVEFVEATATPNLEEPAIKDVSPSETNLLGNLSIADDAVLAGAIASNDADIEPTDTNLPVEISTEEIPSQVTEIASPDVSGTPEQLLVQQYLDSDATTLDAELPNVPEAAFDEVADAAEAEAVTEAYENADIALHPSTLDTTPESGINAATIAGGTATDGTGAVWSAISNHSDRADANVVQTTNVETPVTVTTNESAGSIINTPSTISLNARTPKWAYATWNIADTDKENKRQQGGTQLILRLYDVTDIDLSYQAPQLVQQYECEETIKNRFVAIPNSDRDYMTEIGYLSTDDRWLPIVGSRVVRIFSRPYQEFWFEADAELIVHGATEPGSTVTVGGHAVKLKPDGTFHLRIPFTEELIDYVMTAVANDGEKAKTIHMHFSQENQK